MTTITHTFYYLHEMNCPPAPLTPKDAAAKFINGETVTLGPVLVKGVEYE
jgi:hypothetical protein